MSLKYSGSVMTVLPTIDVPLYILVCEACLTTNNKDFQICS